MDVIFDSLVNTDWGIILLGTLIFIAFIIEFFSNKPRT